MNPDKPSQGENHGEGDRSPAFRAHRAPRTKVSLDELMAKGRTMVDRVEAAVRRLARRIRRSN